MRSRETIDVSGVSTVGPMGVTPRLRLRLAQYTQRGQHARNQDCHGACVPRDAVLQAKGAALAIADGIGSSTVSHMASEIAVRSVLEDYFSTPESWLVKKSAGRVVAASNAWLHAQSRMAGHTGALRDQDCACTLSMLILKSCTAHVFHVGDARVYRLRQGRLEQLTRDHRMQLGDRDHLTRALGTEAHVELDYQTVTLEVGDIFALMTDGVHEHVSDQALRQVLAAAEDLGTDLDALAAQLVADARANGSPDDATVQFVQIVGLPPQSYDDLKLYAGLPPCPPLLSVGQQLDSSRSHVYLVERTCDAPGLARESPARVVMKIPSLDGRQDPAYLERLLLEEWMARQIDSAHVLRSVPVPTQRSHLYVLSEYVPGITLTAWMRANPHPSLDTVRAIVEQVARGLQAMHRREILHRDLRPDNVLIDAEGVVRIIDLGSAKATGFQSMAEAAEPQGGMGTLAYSAPELFLGVSASVYSDQYASAAITYQMLSGRLPYGAKAARTRSAARTRWAAEQARLAYTPVVTPERDLPVWIDDTLARALHPDPARRFEALSELVEGLRQPVTVTLSRRSLIERDPVRFWQGMCVALLVGWILSLWALAQR